MKRRVEYELQGCTVKCAERVSGEIPAKAASLGINRSAVSKHLKSLQQSGIILRVGPDKGGHWEIAEGKEKKA